MSHKRRRHHRPARTKSGCGVNGIVSGLARRFGVGKGVVITGFVLGFIFAPLLTLLIGFGAWFWVRDPAEFESRMQGAADRARRAYQWTFGSRTPTDPSAEAVMADPVPEFPALRREFERLEERAGSLEQYVSSEEFRLQREFRHLDGAS
ncbi:MAG: hypothetical protein AAF458_04780 [Pseudomonadota bacterium]